MIRYIKVALGAAVLLGASQADAANFLIVDITSVGSGLGYRNVGSTVDSFTFTTFYASLSYNLEGPYAPRVDGNTLSVIGANSSPSVSGAFKSDGFSFRAIGPDPRSGFSILGNGCFANSSPTTVTLGSQSVDPACGSIAVSSNNGSTMSSYRFNGAVTGINFRVVDVASLPGITFAIPEPTTWALMLAGFAMVGYAMRRRRPQVVYA